MSCKGAGPPSEAGYQGMNTGWGTFCGAVVWAVVGGVEEVVIVGRTGTLGHLSTTPAGGKRRDCMYTFVVSESLTVNPVTCYSVHTVYV